MKSFFVESCIAAALAVLAIMVLNPMRWWMPDMLTMLLLVGLLAFFCLFAVYVWRERGGDEREELHRMHAGRVAYLAGAFVLVAGILAQGLSHATDQWLVLALVVMVLGKAVARIYSAARM